MRPAYELGSLPEDCLLAIFKALPYASKRALAQANKRLNAIFRSLCTMVDFDATSAEELKSFALSQPFQRFPNAVRCTITLGYSTSNLLYLGCLVGIDAPSLTELTVQFAANTCFPSRGISFTHFRAFKALTTLALGLADPLEQACPCRLNSNGGLSALAFLPNLRDLTLSNLESDQGLDQLNQVTFLSITFPNQGETELDNFCCRECDDCHYDVVVEYLDSTAEGAPIILGPAIKHMRNLQELVLNFNCNYEISVNCLINCFRWGESPTSGDKGTTATPTWPSLTTLELQCIGHIAQETFQNIQEIGLDLLSELKVPGSGLDMWESSQIFDAFRSMPALKAYRLQIDDCDELINETGVHAFTDSEKGVFHTPLYGNFCTDEDGVTCLEVGRPVALAVVVEE